LVPITIKKVHIEELKIFDPKFIFTCTFPTRTKKKKSNKRKINKKKWIGHACSSSDQYSYWILLYV
jgi:hypothetical protein